MREHLWNQVGEGDAAALNRMREEKKKLKVRNAIAHAKCAAASAERVRTFQPRTTHECRLALNAAILARDAGAAIVARERSSEVDSIGAAGAVA